MEFKQQMAPSRATSPGLKRSVEKCMKNLPKIDLTKSDSNYRVLQLLTSQA